MKIRAWVMTDRVGSKVSRDIIIDDEDLEGMSENERLAYIDVEAYEAIQGSLEYGWEDVS